MVGQFLGIRNPAVDRNIKTHAMPTFHGPGFKNDSFVVIVSDDPT